MQADVGGEISDAGIGEGIGKAGVGEGNDAGADEATGQTLSTEEAVRDSRTMRGLEAVGENWMGKWIRQWGFGREGVGGS